MFRIQRLVYYILFVALFTFTSLSLLSQIHSNKSIGIDQNSLHSTGIPQKADPNGEKYLSWFPHSDFPEQQESFRNALRLAIETKRTIIAPMLRVNTIYPWLPFEKLSQRYEAQEKSSLKELCAQGKKNWQTELEPCETINDWIEIPWSSIMDLEIIKKEYGIKIIERTQGHGWGIHESALGGNIHPDDVVVVDVMSFENNGTSWEHPDLLESSKSKKKDADLRLTGWFQSIFSSKPKKTKSIEPLKNVFTIQNLHAIDAKILQFGALNSASRYPTTQTPLQTTLRKAMMKTRFNVPDRFTPLTTQAMQIIDTLGGKFKYSTLILHLSKLVATDARAGSVQRLEVDGDTEEEILPSGPKSIEDLSEKSKKELMDAVVLEIFGDIPINQAVSAAMPIMPSNLLTLLDSGRLTSHPNDRRRLLDACIDYHNNVEKRYPIYYLIIDMPIAPETRPDIFKPVFDMFPCLFSKYDMINWGIQSEEWAHNQPTLNDTNINYEKMFQPLLDILIAGKGYSFFEIPTTHLTRFLNWSPKN